MNNELIPNQDWRDILVEEFLIPDLAQKLGDDKFLEGLSNRVMDDDLAEALSKHYGNSKQFWINLSSDRQTS